MATNMEIRTMQRRALFDLHVLRKDELAKGNNDKVTLLDLLILRQEAEMMEEDVNWVMVRVAKLP